MKTLKIFFLLWLFTFGAAHCTESPEQKKRIHILFVGNSLTYANDLPTLVKNRLTEFNVLVDVMAKPNYALEDHWNDGRLPVLLASNNYDFVIIQQGPSSQQEGREMLMDYGKKIKELCTQNGSQLAFFMVWPAYSNYEMFDGVIKNYTDAATATKSILCPVGKVWKQHFSDTKDLSYYGSDMFHPSKKGSEVAADVIASVISEHI